MKLSVKAFGLACGIFWGLTILLLPLAIVLGFSDISLVIDFIGKFYLGYEATLVGSLIGAVWGFLDAGIGGLIFAWIYNKLLG